MKKLKTDILITGGGPVGLYAALLLQKYKIPFLLIEKNNNLRTHPSAHYINMRSMENFSEIDGLSNQIIDNQENIENYRYYRYQRRLLEKNSLYGITDHFCPSPQQKYEYLQQFSYQIPIHLPQYSLVQILHQNIQCQKNILFNHQLNSFKIDDRVISNVIDNESQQNIEIESKYMIGCDGFHSTVRTLANIEMSGNQSLQNFLNIFFESQDLADQIMSNNEQAMLHFIYNSDIVAVLVNHSLKDGKFVLQVPIHPPFQNINTVQENEQQLKQIVNLCIDKNKKIDLDKINILQVNKWNMSAMVADKYTYKNKIFLAGDASHSFPPAGGFGMNTGIQDIHNLIHKLIYSKCDQTISQNYEQERQYIAKVNTDISMKYYQKSVEIAQNIGLDIKDLNSFKNVLQKFGQIMPSAARDKIFNIGVKIGSMNTELPFGMEELQDRLSNPELQIPLIFVREDIGFWYNKGNFDSQNRHNLKGRLIHNFYGQLVQNQITHDNVSLRQIIPWLQSQNFEKQQLIVLYFENSEPNLKEIDQNQYQLTYVQFCSHKNNKEIQFICDNNDSDSQQFIQQNQNKFIVVRTDGHIFGVFNQ